MQKVINHEWTYEQSPSEVWEYLTQAELISLWLMPNNFEPTVGHEFQLKTKPMPALNLDGIFHCKVLEIIPVEKLTYSWRGGSGDGIFTLDTVCEWILEPNGNGTRLKLKQSGFNENNTDIFVGMTDGWLKKIEQMLNLIHAKKTAK